MKHGTKSGQATYCPEDNKLRLYVGRVPRECYDELRAMGWTSTPKQDCDFVATWTPDREDAALDMIDEGDDIGDEDQSPEDRAADRAERFAGYRDRRMDEAEGFADRYESGPSAFGFQNGAKALRQAAKRDRVGRVAVSQWSKAEYWTYRTAGVISHALYRSRPSVRRSRILKLEADLRRFEARPEYYPRWIQHTRNRLAYENAMLEAVGGKASELDIEPGGFFGAFQVEKVNRSNVTGRVVSVIAYGPSRADPTKRTLHRLNVERLGEDAYRAPTDEERAAFAVRMTQVKADEAEQRKANPKPQLINPTEAEAQRLQDHLNAIERKRWEDACKRDRYQLAAPPQVSEIAIMRQKSYSVRASTYGPCETLYLLEDGSLYRDSGAWCKRSNMRKLCKVRVASSNSYRTAYRVVVLSDKPQKALPQWETAEVSA